MGTYEGSAMLIAADGTEQPVKHVSVRTRADRTRPGVSTWDGRLDAGDGLLLPAGDATLRLPDGSAARIHLQGGGSFTGTATPTT